MYSFFEVKELISLIRRELSWREGSRKVKSQIALLKNILDSQSTTWALDEFLEIQKELWKLKDALYVSKFIEPKKVALYLSKYIEPPIGILYINQRGERSWWSEDKWHQLERAFVSTSETKTDLHRYRIETGHYPLQPIELSKIIEKHKKIFKDLESIGRKKHQADHNRINNLSTDFLNYLYCTSFGLNADNVQLPRYLSIKIYLSDSKSKDHVFSSLKKFLNALAIDIVGENEGEVSSWFQKLIGKLRDPKTRQELNEEIKKGKRALDLALLHKKQAEVDKMLADAASGLIKSLENVDDAKIQMGSLLIMKHKGKIIVRSLSQKELEYLEGNQELLKNTPELLSELEKLNKVESIETYKDKKTAN